MTVARLVQKLAAELPDITADDLHGRVVQLANTSLLTTSGTIARPAIGQSTNALAQGARGLQSALSGLIVWQVRGLQPDRFLERLAPAMGWLFSGAAVKFWLGFSVVTALAVVLDFARLATAAKGVSWFSVPQATGVLLLVFLMTRAIHELGHAIVCKRFSIRCPDIGLLVIMGAPCMYCDVSESWQLPSRWQRAEVAAAGMYVELVMASLAGWLWLATTPGPVNELALQVMFVCSLSTLVINANPLMKFDGYYILSDWLDEVNLRGKADGLLASRTLKTLLGRAVEQKDASLKLGRKRKLALELFSAAGWLYRVGLSVSIATIIVVLASRWQLVWLGRLLAIAVLLSWWVIPMIGFAKRAIREARARKRTFRLAVLSIACVWGVCVVPLPSRQFAIGTLQATNSRGVYAQTDARLVAIGVADGQAVEQGQVLFRLESPLVQSQLVQRLSASRRAAVQLVAVRRQRNMHLAEIDLQPYETTAQSLKSLYEAARDEAGRLVLKAPNSGRIASSLAGQGDNRRTSAAAETRYWTEPEMLGRWVRAGELLATIHDDRFSVIVPLTAAQMCSVAVGTEARVRLSDAGNRVISAQVRSLVKLESTAQRAPVQDASHSSASEGHYAAIIDLPQAELGVELDIRRASRDPKQSQVHSLGQTADIVFHTGSESVLHKVSRWVHRNLRHLSDS